MTETTKRKGGRPKPPADETKAQRFVRLANARVTKALDAIANIGGLANPANYESTEEQRQKIINAIDGEMQNLVKRFNKPSGDTKAGFSL